VGIVIGLGSAGNDGLPAIAMMLERSTCHSSRVALLFFETIGKEKHGAGLVWPSWSAQQRVW
jgi:hypothetical protein